MLSEPPGLVIDLSVKMDVRLSRLCVALERRTAALACEVWTREPYIVPCTMESDLDKRVSTDRPHDGCRDQRNE